MTGTLPVERVKKRRCSKPHRAEVPKDVPLCAFCTAKCCRYFALAIDSPDTWKDFEYMRWFLLHEGAAVFTEDGDWYLLVYGACKHLRPDQRCAIYPTRPRICREYTTGKCEYDDTWVYDRYLETAEQVEEYAEAVLGPRRGRGIRSPRARSGATAKDEG
jgi:Fe-S-cluster containining protein